MVTFPRLSILLLTIDSVRAVSTADGDAALSPLGEFTGTKISERFTKLYSRGIEAPKLHLSSSPPSQVMEMLADTTLVWDDLGGNSQRMLLWNAGFVLTNDSHLTSIRTKCGHTMDDIVISRDAFQQYNCPSVDCYGALRSSNCPMNKVSSMVKCGVAENIPVASNGAFWAQEENNTDIPKPYAVGHASGIVSIQMQAEEASGSNCPFSHNIIVPCVRLQAQDEIEWCAPKPCPAIQTLLKKFEKYDVVEHAQSDSKSSSFPVLWVVLGVVVAFLLIAGYLVYRRRRRSKQQTRNSVSHKQTHYDYPCHNTYFPSSASLDFSAEHNESWDKTPLGTPSSHQQQEDSRQEYDQNRAAVCTDVISASPVMMTFQMDSTIIEKRVPMVDIQIEKVLRRGASGEVALGYLSDQPVALKTLVQSKKYDAKEIERFALEIQLTIKLCHPNIVHIEAVAFNSFHHLIMAMELKTGGDLRQALQKNGQYWSWQDEKLRIAMGLAKALAYLESCDPPIVHRDIKSRNVLIDGETLEPALCDFGLSCRTDESIDRESDVAGTLYWTAPESIRCRTYSTKTDVYSFGVVLTELDTCELPYQEEKDDGIEALRVAQMVVDDTIRPALSGSCPAFIQALAQCCMQNNPEKRPSAAAIVEYLHTSGMDVKLEYDVLDACNSSSIGTNDVTSSRGCIDLTKD